MKSMAFEKSGRVLVMVHGPLAPSAEDWQAMIDFTRPLVETAPVSFIYSAGGAPDSKQRKALVDALGERTIRVALVSQSRVVLAIGVAISWFNPALKTFSPAHLKGAMEHLELSEREAGEVLNVTRLLARQVGVTHVEMDLGADEPRKVR
jgi:hypothetical protein